MVGRHAELTRLHDLFNKARGGQRQVVFVTGEPGIGKTTVVETFLGQVAGEEELWIGQGQCIEHYGAGEAYLPVLEAWAGCVGKQTGNEVIALLRQQAPTWLVQMPALLSTDGAGRAATADGGSDAGADVAGVGRGARGDDRRAAAGLVLEDLHWSDVSTLDLLSMLARRRERPGC